jgi:hypothetical protein
LKQPPSNEEQLKKHPSNEDASDALLPSPKNIIKPTPILTQQHGININNWQYSYGTTPQQPNAHDCGVHVCIHVLCEAINVPLQYDPNRMDDFRIYIFNCIVHKKILPIIDI